MGLLRMGQTDPSSSGRPAVCSCCRVVARVFASLPSTSVVFHAVCPTRSHSLQYQNRLFNLMPFCLQFGQHG